MQKRKHIQPIQRLGNLNTKKKLLIVLGVAVLLVLGIFTWNQYQDAQNKEFLEQIAADFFSLQTSLEQELGIEVENKSGCFTTSEKFNEGKTGCFLRLETSGSLQESIDFTLSFLSDNQSFNNLAQFREDGYNVMYKGSDCKFGSWPLNEDAFYLECPFAVRASNKDLLNELGL